MRVEIQLFATFREIVGRKTITRTVEADSPVGEVLRGVEREFPDLDLFEASELRGHVNVLVNGRNVIHVDGLDTSLEEGDRISVFPPVEGG